MKSCPVSFPLRLIYCVGCVLFFGLLSGFSQTVYEQLVVRNPLPTPNNITSLSYGNGKFLATTDRGGILLSSEDGINWEILETPHPNSLGEITYGNGLYCAASSGSGPVYFSSDLVNWTTVTSNNLPSNNDNVYFNNNDSLFYFGGGAFGNNSGIVTTSDGVTFDHVPTPAESTIRDFVFANNLFVAVGDGLEIMTSPDGVNWTLRPTGSGIEGLGQGLLHINYLNSLFVVGGKSNTILTSPDGITWTKRDFTEDSSWFFDSWYDAGTYYFPGRQGTIWTTTDFTSWTGIDLGSNDDVYHIVNEEGITVVTGRTGNIFTSTDQTNWTSRKSGFTNNFSGAAYGAGIFVISDFNGNVLKSTDGITWDTSFTPGIDVGWVTVVFADSKFVAMSSRGEWILSPSGLPGQWSLPTDEIEGATGIRQLRYLNNKWYIVGRDGFLRSSTNLTDWDVHDIATTNDFEDITYESGIFVVVGQGGEIYTSTNGTIWTARDSTTTGFLSFVMYGNGKFVVLGSSGTALTSDDGITWSSENQSNPPFFPQELTFREGQFAGLDTQGRVSLSSDGLSWTTVNMPVGVNISSTAVSDTVLVAVGQAGAILSGDIPPPKNLVVTIVGEGDVTISPEGPSYPHLSKVTLTAVGTPDFAFSNWSGDASGNTNPLLVTMDSDKTITANFVLALTGYELWRYLEFTSEERADDEVSGPEADPDNDGLTNNDEFLLGTNPKEFNAPKNLVINIEGEGEVTISPEGGGPYTFMSEVTLTAVGTPEFDFSSWSGDASGSNNPLVVTMDNDKNITANFVLTLTGYSLWRYGLFNQEERANDDLSGPQADFDGDGLSNLEEYLRGTDPKVPNFEEGLEPYVDEVEGEFYLFVPYIRDKSVGGVEQRVEVGDNLVNWLSGPTYSEIFSVEDNGDGTETVTIRILDSIGSKDSWFVRLFLSEPD